MSDAVRQVGRYRIVREIGRGGMAAVYLARQVDLDRDVALKELNAFAAADPAFAERFMRESRVAGSMSHPNIVTVFEFLTDAGTPYIAMEYMEHGSLRPYVATTTMAQTIGVLESTLAGLAEAERREVVHRDIKPENLMVTRDGEVKITDFGIAKGLTEAGGPNLTVTGTTVGTPAYMAPEQATAGAVGPWTDLYSVGITAYEMTVARVPFHDSTTPVAVLLRQVSEEIPSAVSIDPNVDRGFSDWIDRLLVKDPEKRTQSAREAWYELEEIAVSTLGPLWRREARLHVTGATRSGPLTPAPFDRPTPRPADGQTGYRTYAGDPQDQAAPPPVPPPAAAPPAPTPPPTPATQAPTPVSPPAAEAPAPYETYPGDPQDQAAPPPAATPPPAPTPATQAPTPVPPPAAATPPPPPIPPVSPGVAGQPTMVPADVADRGTFEWPLAHGRRRRPAALIAAIILVAAIAAGAAVWTASRGSGSGSASGTTSTPPLHPDPGTFVAGNLISVAGLDGTAWAIKPQRRAVGGQAAEPGMIVDLADRGKSVPSGDHPGSLAFGGGSLWLSSTIPTGGQVRSVDPTGSPVLGPPHKFQGAPGHPRPVISQGVIWQPTNDKRFGLWRIPVHGGPPVKVTGIDFVPYSVELFAGFIWASGTSDHKGILARVPLTGTPTAKVFPLPGAAWTSAKTGPKHIRKPVYPAWITGTRKAVYVISSTGVTKVDAANPHNQTRVPNVSSPPDRIAIVDGILWMVSYDLKSHPKTGRIDAIDIADPSRRTHQTFHADNKSPGTKLVAVDGAFWLAVANAQGTLGKERFTITAGRRH